ncbi:MAG: FAD-binding oxidoreductase, partial [Candidatus Binataceae bacterium]
YGCCGLAGPFGFQKDHYKVSLQVGETGLLPAVRDAPSDTLIVSNGFSCRKQIEHATDRQAVHPAEVLRMALQEERRRSQPKTPGRRIASRIALPAAMLGLALAASAGFAYGGATPRLPG